MFNKFTIPLLSSRVHGYGRIIEKIEQEALLHNRFWKMACAVWTRSTDVGEYL